MDEVIIGNLDPEARPTCFRNIVQEVLFVGTVMLANAATTFVQGVVVISTETIGNSLHMSPVEVTWISAAIGLGSGCFMLPAGKIADVFGRKIILVVGMFLLSIFALLAGFAPSAIVLDIFCGVLGLGTALIAPPAIGMLFATYPAGKRRNKAAAALGVGNPLGFILGSFISGGSVRLSDWRTSFYLVAGFFFILMIITIWSMPSRQPFIGVSKQIQQFDYLGTALTIVGMAMVIAALTEGPLLGWKSPQVILLLLVGVSSLLGFGTWEQYFLNPLVDPVVWKNKTFSLCILCTIFGYMSFITNQFWLCLYMQSIQHLSPLTIAIRLLPQALIGVLWSYIAQNLVSKINGTLIMAIGACAYLVGAVLCCLIRTDSSYWHYMFPSIIITVIGADFQFIVSNLYITINMPGQSSTAAGILQTAMRLSIAVGLGITSGLFYSTPDIVDTRSDPIWRYQKAFLCSLAFTIAGILTVPFMKIETQGNVFRPAIRPEICNARELTPPSMEVIDHRSVGENHNIHNSSTINRVRSGISFITQATAGSVNSYFPKWSWEFDGAKAKSKHDSTSDTVLYEVCVKCLEERRVFIHPEPHVAVADSNDNIVDSDKGKHTSITSQDHLNRLFEKGWPRSSNSCEDLETQAPRAYDQIGQPILNEGHSELGYPYRSNSIPQPDQCLSSRGLTYGLRNENIPEHSGNSGAIQNRSSDPRKSSGNTSYYSLRSNRDIKLAADVFEAVDSLDGELRNVSNKNEALGHQQEIEAALHFHLDDQHDYHVLTHHKQLHENSYSRHRYALPNHVKDLSLSGKTLREGSIDLKSNDDYGTVMTLPQGRNILDTKSRVPIRVSEKVNRPYKFAHTQAKHEAHSAETSHYDQEMRYDQDRARKFQILLPPDSTPQRFDETRLGTFSAPESHFSFKNLDTRTAAEGKNNTYHNPPVPTITNPRPCELENSNSLNKSTTQRCSGSSVHNKSSTEHHDRSGDYSDFSFTPSISIPPKSPLRKERALNTHEFQGNSMDKSGITDANQNQEHQVPKQVAQTIGLLLAPPRAVNKAGTAIVNRRVDVESESKRHSTMSCPEIPSRRSSLHIDTATQQQTSPLRQLRVKSFSSRDKQSSEC